MNLFYRWVLKKFLPQIDSLLIYYIMLHTYLAIKSFLSPKDLQTSTETFLSPASFPSFLALR